MPRNLKLIAQAFEMDILGSHRQAPRKHIAPAFCVKRSRRRGSAPHRPFCVAQRPTVNVLRGRGPKTLRARVTMAAENPTAQPRIIRGTKSRDCVPRKYLHKY